MARKKKEGITKRKQESVLDRIAERVKPARKKRGGRGWKVEKGDMQIKKGIM